MPVVYCRLLRALLYGALCEDSLSRPEFGIRAQYANN